VFSFKRNLTILVIRFWHGLVRWKLNGLFPDHEIIIRIIEGILGTAAIIPEIKSTGWERKLKTILYWKTFTQIIF